MRKLNKRSFSISIGITSLFLYVLCSLVLTFIGEDRIIKIANLIFHGVDFSDIIRLNISFTESFVGAFISFLLWSSIGYLIALLYNFLNKI